MALYKYAAYLTQSTDAAFDALHNPGVPTPHSGIYRCEGCGHEIVSETGKTLPPQNHHQHPNPRLAIQWRLAVYPQSK
jgi:hypothetical protein